MAFLMTNEVEAIFTHNIGHTRAMIRRGKVDAEIEWCEAEFGPNAQTYGGEWEWNDAGLWTWRPDRGFFFKEAGHAIAFKLRFL